MAHDTSAGRLFDALVLDGTNDSLIDVPTGMLTPKSTAALWPPQKAPQLFRGSDDRWLHVDGTQGQSSERRPLDSDPQGTVGIDGSITLPTLANLKTTYSITANIGNST